MSKNAAGNYRVGGQSYSESELEEIAERIEKSSYSQLTIDKYFLGEAKTEEELRKRLVITHYFLAKDRRLTKEMRGLLASGINEFLGGGKSTWQRPKVKSGNDKEALILMLAIDQVFPRSLHEIAAALGIGYEAAKARKASARRLLKGGIALEEHLQMLTSGLRGIPFEDGTKFHLKVYDKNEALDLLEDPSKGERFIRSVIDFFYK